MGGYVLEIASKSKSLVRRGKLSEEEWEELAYAIIEVINHHLRRRLTSPAEKNVLDVLDDVVEVDCEGVSAGRIAYVFHDHWSLGALCGCHWYGHAMAAVWDEIGALFTERGRRVVGEKPDVAAEYGPQQSYALAFWDDNVLAVSADGDTIFSGGDEEDAVLSYDSELLDTAARALARALYDTGLCRCALCVETRPAGVEGKTAELRRRK